MITQLLVKKRLLLLGLGEPFWDLDDNCDLTAKYEPTLLRRRFKQSLPGIRFCLKAACSRNRESWVKLEGHNVPEKGQFHERP